MSLPSINSGDVVKSEKSNFINMVYNYDWSSTSLGPIDRWDPAIKNLTNLILNTEFPICVFINPPDWILIYNKAYLPILKSKHPEALGMRLQDVFPEAFESRTGYELNNVIATGKGVYGHDEGGAFERDGYIEEVYFCNTFSPVFKSDGTIDAILCLVQETTQKVIEARRLQTISEFGYHISGVETLENACHIVTKVLSNNKDIPYTLIYLIKHTLNASSESPIAHLIATTFDNDNKKRHIPDYLPETHEVIDLAKNANKNYDTYIEIQRGASIHSFLKCDSWPIYLALKEREHVKILLRDESRALLFSTKISQTLSVLLIYGVDQMHTIDEKHMEFLQLVTDQINIFLQRGKSIEEEKERTKMLTYLNCQKISFLQGISHELKTPLTLMISPLDEVINACLQESPIMPHLQIIRRNARRLLKLVNVLLQFSNLESNQLKVHYREINIAEFTQELASDFKNMAKTLGLDYIIDIPNPDEFNRAVGDKVYLDRDMYETIVFNLCSNAFKHTWSGQITIRLYLDYKDNKKMIVLEVSDTGVGIPEIALPNIFRRFYRVESQESRSHEGTGIGLSLVKELITLHGGDITVSSVVNQGTIFRCWFPIGCDHLLTNQIDSNNMEIQMNHDQELYTNRQLYLEESSLWIKNKEPGTQDVIMDQFSTDNLINYTDKISMKNNQKYKVLIVDDNSDMRTYLTDLLSEFEIYRARDGKDALRVLKTLKNLPDLIISDIMMPNMDGYELLDVLRSDLKTLMIPVILLSAKAGETSKIKGLDKGADDYLVKPFSTQELIIRIRANIELSLARRKIFFHRYKQEDTKQLLVSITNTIISKLDLNETLLYTAREIYRRLSCERIFIISNGQSKNNKIVVSGEEENPEYLTPVANPFLEISDNNKSNLQSFTKLQKNLNTNSGVDISLDVYCDDVCKNVSILSVEILLDNENWGWIKVHRSPNSIWTDSEIEFLQQISNQLNMAIEYTRLLKENREKEIQIKAAEIASNTKSQILANTSHELRTPLNAVVCIASSFEGIKLATNQRDMLNIISNASDVVVSTINDILNVAKLGAKKIILVNRTFDLLELLDSTIDTFGKKAGSKKIELIVNCEVDMLPRYVKSDPERLKQVLSHLLSNAVKFTNEGEIVLTISMKPRENEVNLTCDQVIKKEVLFLELYDTGIGINPEYIQHAWKSFSQGDMSITRKQDGVGLGLSICKSLVEINGGEIKAESQLGKGSKFSFTWNVELLSMMSLSRISQFNEQISYLLPRTVRKKQILIIHSVESVRNSLLKYLKRVEKVDAFDTFDKGIRAAKSYKELYQHVYDIVFISLYENNKGEAMNAVLELKELEKDNSLAIIFIVFPSDEGIKLASELIELIGKVLTFVIYAPITWNKLISQFKHMENNKLM